MVANAYNFNDGSVPGKMQYGAAWWFLDQIKGMEDQLNALSSLGLLSRFVGMLTDSRSFLSYPRHEYFRRILCNMLGNEIEKGLLPASEFSFIDRWWRTSVTTTLNDTLISDYCNPHCNVTARLSQ